MQGRLTTHMLDTAAGVPAKGVGVRLYRYENGQYGPRCEIASAQTNADGRCDAPLLEGDAFAAGCYCLEFDVAAYLRREHGKQDKTFFEVIPVNFRIAEEDRHYHVPLLLSPFGYSTYRGS